jgi:predicted alpha/beta superfamily hydrolase
MLSFSGLFYLLIPMLFKQQLAAPPIVESYILHSAEINDDYIIKVIKPGNFAAGKEYRLIFAADGSIGLGDLLAEADSTWNAKASRNSIIVTLGHTGNWKEKRRRDFIPSDITGNESKEFGGADKFYEFLKNKVIPFVQEKYPGASSSSFIGHSFSGLFCLYAALRNENIFDQYFAISPSVWANKNELRKIEEAFASSNTDLSANIQIYVGGLELLNKVRSSTTKFYKNINKRNYSRLKINLGVISNANHFSIRKPAIDKILSGFPD